MFRVGVREDVNRKCNVLLVSGRSCILVTNRVQLLSSSIGFHLGGLNCSLALQHHTGQTALSQALTLGHMRSINYWTTKYLLIVFYCQHVNESFQP